MSLQEALHRACREVGIQPPRTTQPGRWVKCPVEGKAASNGAGRVLIWPEGNGGIAWNHVTAQSVRFAASGDVGTAPAPDRAQEQARRREEAQRQAEVAHICEAIVRAAAPDKHPYLADKGFPEERGLVHPDPRQHFPNTRLGNAMRAAFPEGEGPWLIIPGRIGRAVATVQIIGPDGGKKNILGGKMGGAAHRIATGRETWVCEGIATALTVRAALRLLSRSATVLSAFSASNVAKVAKAIPGAIIAADNDRPLEQLHGLGTGEFYARATGLTWVMPPALGDFNDQHQRDSLRTVALTLREVPGK